MYICISVFVGYDDVNFPNVCKYMYYGMDITYVYISLYICRCLYKLCLCIYNCDCIVYIMHVHEHPASVNDILQ